MPKSLSELWDEDAPLEPTRAKPASAGGNALRPAVTPAPRRRGKYDARHTIICVWCGERHECVKEDKQACSNKCRLRLMRFRRRTGFDPEFPPGEQSVEEAIAALFRLLCARERIRRENQKLLASVRYDQRCALERQLDTEGS